MKVILAVEEDSFGFSFAPDVDRDAWSIEDEEDVQQLVDDGVIGTGSEYGYRCYESFIEDVVAFLGVDEFTDLRQRERSEKWQRFCEEYEEGGGVFYNPSNPDEYYTDDPELLQ